MGVEEIGQIEVETAMHKMRPVRRDVRKAGEEEDSRKKKRDRGRTNYQMRRWRSWGGGGTAPQTP